MHFETFSKASSIDRETWNELARPAGPLMEWEYFTALEDSGSVTPDRGYSPLHLLAYSDGRPAALAPLYQRDRSWVEFGDGGLIQFLSEMTGIPYERGLVAGLPFTPVPAYEFLYRSDVEPSNMARSLLDYMDYLCATRNLFTSRVYFVSSRSRQLHDVLKAQGYFTFKTSYCLWLNRGYSVFDDFLETFKSSRRTKIRREIKTIRNLGIDLRMVEGSEAPDDYFSAMADLYLRTWRKHMGPEIQPFLKSSFFDLLKDSFRQRIKFCVADKNGQEQAMAFFYHKDRLLHGRYWGCFQEIPFLHFALCYYYPIEYAIAHGYEVMDPGYGGEHKLTRGFEVLPIFHYIKFHGERESRIAGSILRKLHVQARVDP